MKLLQAPNLAKGHEIVIRYIMNHCYKDETECPIVYPGENKQDTIEAKELALFIRTPFVEPRFIKPPTLPFSQKYMDQYANDLIAGTSADFVYDYHDRLTHHFGINQITYIEQKLIGSPSTRRAQAITWNPKLDTTREDVPCLQLIHCDVREGRLNMKVVFRSEDMTLGLGPNMYGLTELQKHISLAVGLPVGTYTHICFCPHLYLKRDEDYIGNVMRL
jgi:thymidylate synthase